MVNIAKALESTVDYLVSGPSPVSGTAETVVIQLNHPKAMQLLSALEELDLIHILKKTYTRVKSYPTNTRVNSLLK
ncbi:MAG: hypothetical protein IPN33_05025 [Saprospiraceae bacterium]|nr:hypothetical protein [Saprospiraceae bacterium]